MEIKYRLSESETFMVPEIEFKEVPKIGSFGKKRLQYLQNTETATFIQLYMDGTLNSHLEEIDRQANEMLEQLIRQMADEQGVTEQMKANDPMKWVGLMNNIKNSATEIVLTDLIYN